MYDTFRPDAPVGLMDFVKAARTRVSELTPAELQQLTQERDDLLTLDVREASEHEQGYLPEAMLVPRGILEAAADPGYPKHVPDLVSARARPVVVYCATGGRSAMAAAVLEMMGFGEVYSLAGGIVEWEKAGLPLAREARYV